MLYAFLFRRETLRGSSPLLLMMFEWNEQAQKWRAKNLSSLTYTKPRPTFSYTPAIFSAFKSRTGRRSLNRPRGGISNMFRPNTRIYDAWMELFPHMPFDQNMNILFGIWYARSQLLPYLACFFKLLKFFNRFFPSSIFFFGTEHFILYKTFCLF